jgi:succinoglycan biosynthesis transport protein ExoP
LHAEDRTELPDSGYLDAAEDETVVRLRDQYRVMQSELPPRPLDQRERGPDDSALAARLAEQRDKLWNAVYADAEAVKKNLEAARLREATIVRRLQEITPRLDAVHAQFETLKALNAKHQSAQQLRDSLQNRYARVSQFIQQQSIPVTEARIITEATPPLSKSSPKRTLIFLLALFGGGVLGIGSAIGREHFDRTVRRPEQIERELGVRPLGAVQLFGGRAKDSPSRPRSAPDAQQKQTNGTDKGTFLTRRIESWLAGPAGETLRRVKIALDEGVRTSQGRVLAVVSPNAREGKTTIALALAVIMARAGKRTCLIDADIREPSLTRALTPGATGGLVSIIGQKPLFADEGVRQLHGFHFIGQGPGFSACHPSEVLGSEAMQDMLDNLRGRFDYIIVDTPPLLPYVDVAAAAATLDAFVLVAESGRTTIEDLRRSFSASDPIEERLVGVLINKSPRAKR